MNFRLKIRIADSNFEDFKTLIFILFVFFTLTIVSQLVFVETLINVLLRIL